MGCCDVINEKANISHNGIEVQQCVPWGIANNLPQWSMKPEIGLPNELGIKGLIVQWYHWERTLMSEIQWLVVFARCLCKGGQARHHEDAAKTN